MVGTLPCSTPHEQKWEYPSIEAATGLWARVLAKSKLKVAGVSWSGGSGDYKTSPSNPTGFWPEYMQASLTEPHPPTLPPWHARSARFYRRPCKAPRRTLFRCLQARREVTVQTLKVLCVCMGGGWGWLGCRRC